MADRKCSQGRHTRSCSRPRILWTWSAKNMAGSHHSFDEEGVHPFGLSAMAGIPLVDGSHMKSGVLAASPVLLGDDALCPRGVELSHSLASAESLEESLTVAMDRKLSLGSSVCVPELPPAPFMLKQTHSIVTARDDDSVVRRVRSCLDSVASDDVRVEMKLDAGSAQLAVVASNGMGEMCSFQVSVWKLPGDAGSYAVEVMRGRGDSFLFADVYRHVSQHLNKRLEVAAKKKAEVPPMGEEAASPDVALRLLSGPATSFAGTEGASALSAIVSSGSFSDDEWLVVSRQAAPLLCERLAQCTEGGVDPFLACSCLRAVQAMLTVAKSTQEPLGALRSAVLKLRDSTATASSPAEGLVHREAMATLAMLR
jgi:hypothetical protein